jgi:hypothetical protein
MMFDKDGRPYVRSPLMAQYFAGHMQTHYKRIFLSWVAIAGTVVVIAGGSVKGCGASAPSSSIGSSEANGRIWDFLEGLPIIGGLEYKLHGPHYDGPDYVEPEDPARANDPLYQHVPTTVAAHVDESGGESAPPQPEDSDFYTCTPGTKWCDS